MARKRHEMGSQEIAMRVLLIVEPIMKKPDFLMAEIVPVLIERFDISRAQAYRLTRCAVDVLSIHYDRDTPGRQSKVHDRVWTGIAAARMGRRAP